MSRNQNGRYFPLLDYSLIFLIYIALALVMTYPLVFNFGTTTPDSGGEPSIFLWNMWHFREGVQAGTLFQTELLNVPFGANLVFHVYTIGRNILAYPLLPILGLIPTHNLLLFLSFGLSGLGMYLLAFDLSDNKWSSFVAGLIYTFAPYRFAHLGQLNLAMLEWLPLFMFFALRYLRGGNGRYLLAATLFGFWTTLDSYYYGFSIAIWFGLAILVISVEEKWRRVSRLTLSLTLAHLPLIGLLGWASRAESWVGAPTGAKGLNRFIAFSADLSAYLIPNLRHPLWRGASGSLAARVGAEGVVYIGLVSLLCAGWMTLSWRRTSRNNRLWIIVFWLFLLFSLGPYLKIAGNVLPVPMPFFWLRHVPLLREARVLARYGVMVLLAGCVITAVSLPFLIAKIKQIRPTMLYLALIGFVLFEFLPAPLFLADRSVPKVYDLIAADPTSGTVLELPFGLHDSFEGMGGWNPQAMYFQTVTNRPLVSAHISRTPRTVFEAYATMPIIGRLITIEEGAAYSQEDIVADRADLNELLELLDLRYFIQPSQYERTASSAYLHDLFGDCLLLLDDDGVKRGYEIQPPCLVEAPR